LDSPVAASDSQVARRPAKTVATSSLQMGMMMAVRASGFITWSRTSAARSVCRSPKSETQKPMSAVTKPVSTQAESTTNSVSCAMRSRPLPPSGCSCQNIRPAISVQARVSPTKIARRQLAAFCQGSSGSRACAGRWPGFWPYGGSRPLAVLSRAVPMLFQKPRQGRGVMEPRLMGGAVTAFG
jgi:hypothetical protein